MAKAGVVAFAFGVPSTIRSNRRIGQIASRKARELGAPVYTQFDVLVGDGIKTYYTEEQPGNPPPSLRIARGAVQWARRNFLDEFWVVAAKPHLWRCVRDLNRAIGETNDLAARVRVCDEIEQFPEAEWFCSDSTRERTRSREAWDKRERILKLMPFFLYKFVAK